MLNTREEEWESSSLGGKERRTMSILMDKIRSLAQGYTITSSPDGASFSVWKEGTEEPYVVTVLSKELGVYTCTCPHYLYRLQGTYAWCKHITMAVAIGAWDDPNRPFKGEKP